MELRNKALNVLQKLKKNKLTISAGCHSLIFSRRQPNTGQKIKISIRISSVNVIKFVANCGFGHIY